MLTLASPELEAQSMTLFHANDYAATLTFLHDYVPPSDEIEDVKIKTWHEIQLQVNPDSTRTIHGKAFPLDVAPEAELPDGGRPFSPTNQSSLEGELFGDAFILVLNSGGTVGQALKVLGYDTRSEESDTVSLAVTYSPVKNVNEKLAELKDKGPGIEVRSYEGKEFPATLMAEGLLEDVVYVADNPFYEMHDMLVHLPTWLLMTPKIRSMITARTGEFYQNMVDAQNSGNVDAYTQAEALFIDYMARLEDTLDNKFISYLDNALEGEYRMRLNLVGILAEVIYPISIDGIPELDMHNLEKDVDELVIHVRAIAAQADNESQN